MDYIATTTKYMFETLDGKNMLDRKNVKYKIIGRKVDKCRETIKSKET